MPPSSLVDQHATADQIMKSLAGADLVSATHVPALKALLDQQMSFPLAMAPSCFEAKDASVSLATVLSDATNVSFVRETRDVHALLAEKMSSIVDSADEDAFFVADLGEIVRQHRRWTRLLPRIEPYYAVKCNPDPVILNEMVNLGIGFDCASRSEIASVLEKGVHPSRLIYANPCKQASHIRYAAEQGVRMMTFDNAEELHKLKKHYPTAELVLRVLTDDSKSICKLGTKFGASPSIARDLLQLAKELELNVVGVSFHVGSGCFDAAAFGDAVRTARRIFDVAKEVGFDLTLLDVGGGFPGNCDAAVSFESIAAVLGPAVDELFPSSVRVIAEPGRFFVASAFTLSVNVTARRTVIEKKEDGQQETKFMYYVNDGVYGSFNCILFDHAVVSGQVLQKNGQFLYGKAIEEALVHCSLWGPTCDSMDCITKAAQLPELDVGDWLYFSNMGAYTMCAASTFNGFKKSSIVYTNTFQQ